MMSMIDNLLHQPVIIPFGLTCLAIHLILYVTFSKILPKGPWSEMPSFTAHQAICFPLMIYLTYVGTTAWIHSDEDPSSVWSTPAGRILGHQPDGLLLARLALGGMLFWDIPVALSTSALSDPLMMIHHIGMAAISAVTVGLFSGGRSVLSCYATFFFGVIELSSIPLTIVDMFHPKNKPWFEYLGTNGFLQGLNDVARMAFALFYLVVRGGYFPWVVFTSVIPDMYHVLNLPEEEREGVPDAALYFTVVSSLLFSLLQFYWGISVFKQVLKVVLGTKGEKKNI